MDKVPDLFLSYASEDTRFAENLAKALEDVGVSVWFAPGQLRPGDSIVEKINTAMATTRFAVLILSPQSLAKSWPRKELNALVALALQDPKRRLIPILYGLTDLEFITAMPNLADIKWISSEHGLEWVVSNLRIVLAESAAEAMPRQQVATESDGIISRFETLADALETAGEDATLIVYPGEYALPIVIGKSVRIISRGSANETILHIPPREMVQITCANFELDGFCLLPTQSLEADTPREIQDGLFPAPISRARILPGDSMFAVIKSNTLGKILFKNSIFDAMNEVDLVLATDSLVEIQTSVVKNAKDGLAARNGGKIQLAGCQVESAGAQVAANANLLVINSTVRSSMFVARESGRIDLEKSKLINSAVHAYSNSRISITNGTRFEQESESPPKDVKTIYATHFCQVEVSDTEFEGGGIPLYVYGGSNLSLYRVTIRNAESYGIRYSEACSGIIEDSRIMDGQDHGIFIQKGANPYIRRCVIEGNDGLGVFASMGGIVNLTDCQILGNGQGGLKSNEDRVTVKACRVFLNNGPGIQVAGATHIELIDSEVGQNANGQLIIDGAKWYPPESLREHLSDLMTGRRNVRVVRTALYS